MTPANASIAAGSTQQFTATGTYSDGSTADLTSQVTWSSSNSAVATMNSTGLATAIAGGNSDHKSGFWIFHREYHSHGSSGDVVDYDSFAPFSGGKRHLLARYLQWVAPHLIVGLLRAAVLCLLDSVSHPQGRSLV